jgi:parallel beta-helix repeat protein
MEISTLDVMQEPIQIMSDLEFEAQGWPGSGTENDPYLIENLNISCEYGEACMRIHNTNACFVIRDCRLEMGGHGRAFQWNNVTNGKIESCVIVNSFCDFFYSRVCVLENTSFSGLSDVYIYNSSYWDIRYNTLEFSDSVIFTIDSVTDSNIVGNSICSGLEGEGFWILNCSRCEFSDNLLHDNMIGVAVEMSNDCLLYNNSIKDNEIGILVAVNDNISIIENTLVNNGIFLEPWSFDPGIYKFNDNTVNGKPIGYFYEAGEMVLDASGFGQLFLVKCIGTEIQGGQFRNATVGVQLINCSHCVVNGVESVDNSEYGCKLDYSYYCDLYNDSFHSNGQGVTMTNCSYCLIIDNVVTYSKYYGIVLYYCENNTIYGNAFGWNGLANAYSDYSPNNSWDDGVSKGNIWSDYDGSGIYYIDEGGIDNFPSKLNYDLIIYDYALEITIIGLIIVVAVVYIYRKRRLQ